MSNDWQWNSPDWRNPDGESLDKGLGNYPTQQSSGSKPSNYEQYSDPVSLPPPPPYASYEQSGGPATPTPYSYYGGQSNDYGQASNPFGPPPEGSYPFAPAPMPVARSRGWLWFWIPALLAVVVLGGVIAAAIYGVHALSSVAQQASQQVQNGTGAPGNGAPGGSTAGPVTLTVGTLPTIVIDRNDGGVQVQSVADSNQITIEPTGSNASDAFGPITYTKSGGNTITFDLSNLETVDVLLKVPSASDLNITTNDGDITVVGVIGQQTLNSNAGNLNATQDTLMGKSTLDTNGGSIIFSGMLDTQSSDTFSTNPGPITLTLPADAAFQATITNNGGVIQSDFPQVTVSGDAASGTVGKAPYAQVEIDSNGGTIQIKKAS